MALPIVGDKYEHMTAHSVWTVDEIDADAKPPQVRMTSGVVQCLVGVAELAAAFRLSMPARYAVGAHCGGGAPGSTNLIAMETWLRRPLDFGIAYGADLVIESVGFEFLNFPAPRKLALGVWLAPNNGTANMATAAGGGYDALYESAANDLLNWQSRVFAVRIGWECTGDWYPWSVGGPGSNQSAANYIAAFRRYAAFIRERCPGMAIDWNVAFDRASPELWYPGDDVVDIVSIDMYQQTAFFPEAFSFYEGAPAGLTWMDTFSAAHGKKMAIPEWATDYPNSDYVSQMAAWMNARASRIAYQGYWNTNDVFSGLLADYPHQQAAYYQAWGVQL